MKGTLSSNARDMKLDTIVDRALAISKQDARKAEDMLIGIGAKELARLLEDETDLDVVSYALAVLANAVPRTAIEVVARLDLNQLTTPQKHNLDARRVASTARALHRIQPRVANTFLAAFGNQRLAALLGSETGLHNVSELLDACGQINKEQGKMLLTDLGTDWAQRRVSGEGNAAKIAVFLESISHLDEDVAKRLSRSIDREGFVAKVGRLASLSELVITIAAIGNFDSDGAQSLTELIGPDKVMQIVQRQKRLSPTIFKSEIHKSVELARSSYPELALMIVEAVDACLEQETHLQAGQGVLSVSSGAAIQPTLPSSGKTSAPRKAGAATSIPLLFGGSGLCANYILESSPNEYFISHEANAEKIADLRSALGEGLSGTHLKPYTADQDLRSGHILCKIAAKIQTTAFCVFDLPQSQDRNVYLELGIAIGLGRPFILVKGTGVQLPSLVEGLDHFGFASYAGLRREIGERVQVGHFSSILPQEEIQTTNSYFLADGEYEQEDFRAAVRNSFRSYALESITIDDAPVESKLALIQLIRNVQTARFGVFRIDEAASANTFLALGISIGLNKPWLLVARAGEPVPLDVRGLSSFNFTSFKELEEKLPKRCGPFLTKHAGPPSQEASSVSTTVQVKMPGAPREHQVEPVDAQVDFAIITALEKEAKAVARRLENHTTRRFESRDIRTYHLGTIPILGREQPYRIVVTTLPSMGNVSAAIAVTDTITLWKPRFLLMVGIAGGVPQDDLDLGDVVVADQVVGYDYGKVTEQEVKPRDRVFPASAMLLDRIRNFWDERWREQIGVERPQNAKRPQSKHFVGPIASGDKIIASTQFREQLLRRWPKLIAVETESEGVYAAAFERPEIVQTLVIRGICDMADERKSDEWQEYAANAAAAFVVNFLKNGPVDVRQGVGGSISSQIRSKADLGPSNSRVSTRSQSTGGLSTDLYLLVHQALLDCGPLATDGELSAVFAHPSLKPWRHGVPQASNPRARADAVIACLLDKRRSDTRENALALLLRVLSERIDSGDECHERLLTLATEVSQALSEA